MVAAPKEKTDTKKFWYKINAPRFAIRYYILPTGDLEEVESYFLIHPDLSVDKLTTGCSSQRNPTVDQTTAGRTTVDRTTADLNLNNT